MRYNKIEMDKIDIRSLLPKYYQLKEILRKKIINQEYQPDKKIPSEPELASRYQVSRFTVNRAISELTRENLLYRIQGKGTFVGKPDRVETHTHFEDGYPAVNPELSNIVALPGTYVHRTFDPSFDINIAGTPTLTFMRVGSQHLQDFIYQGACADITEYINEWEEKDGIYPQLWKPVVKGNHYYGVPECADIKLLLYRKDLFEEAGIIDKNGDAKPPATWDELIEVAQKLTLPRIGQFGYGFSGLTPYVTGYFRSILRAFGGKIVKKEENRYLKVAFNDEKGVKALKLIQDLRWKYKVIQPDLMKDLKSLQRDFVEGRIAMLDSAPTQINRWINAGLITKEQIGMGLLPAGTENNLSEFVSTCYIINPFFHQRQMERAWRRLKSWLSPESIIKRWEKESEKGIPRITMPPFKNLKLSEHCKEIPAEWWDVMKKALSSARPEPYFQRWYLVKRELARPIQKVLFEENVHPQKELNKCAKVCNEKWLKPIRLI